jgi:hypothetical protein
MSSINQRLLNTLVVFDADGEPDTQADNASSTSPTAANTSPFDTLLAGLRQMILLGQTPCRSSTKASARDEGDGQ